MIVGRVSRTAAGSASCVLFETVVMEVEDAAFVWGLVELPLPEKALEKMSSVKGQMRGSGSSS